MKLRSINEAMYHEFSNYDPDDGLEFEEVITKDNMQELGWSIPAKPLRTFKATNNVASQVIPGFTTIDIEEAKTYQGHGDWGGQHIVSFDIAPNQDVTDKDMFLDGRDGPIKIGKGTPAVIQRGTEVIVLRPEEPAIQAVQA